MNERLKAEMQHWADSARTRLVTENPRIPGFVLAEHYEQHVVGWLWGIDAPTFKPGARSKDILRLDGPYSKVEDGLAWFARETWRHAGRVVTAFWIDGQRREREFIPPKKDPGADEGDAVFWIERLILIGFLKESVTSDGTRMLQCSRNAKWFRGRVGG